MTNEMITSSITLNDLIAYATINYIIPNPLPLTEMIATLDTIMPEMRDTLDDIIDDLAPNHSESIDALESTLLALIDSPRFYDRLLDITLARA